MIFSRNRIKITARLTITTPISLLTLAFSLASANAATRTWNPSGDGNFNNAANWSTTLPGTSDIAQFAAASVTGPNVTAPITIGSVNFTSTGTGYDLTSTNSSDALTLMSTSTGAGNSAVAVQVASGNTQIDAPLIFGAAAASTQQISQVTGGTLILNGTISSTNSITLNYAGGGTITINGTNSNTGSSVQTANSTINVGNSSAFGTSTLVFAATNGTLAAGINLTGASAIANAISFSGAQETFANSGANGFEFSGTVDLGGAARTINAKTSAGITFDNVISDDGGGGLTITTASSSNVTLKGANTYTGATTISGTGGVTVSSINTAGNPGNLGTNSVIHLGSTTAAGSLAYNGAGETTDRTIDLSGTTGGATIDTSGATGPLVFINGVTSSGVGAKTLTLRGTDSAVNQINGVIVDSSGGATSLIKRDSGTWSLGGANTYTGTTTILGGTLSVSSMGTIGNPGGAGEASTVELGSGNTAVTLAYAGAGETTDHIIDLAGTTGSATIDTSNSTGALILTGNITASGAGSKTLTLSGGNNDNVQGIISDNSVSDTTSISKTGTGTWILSGANTYSGGTTVRNGTLSVASIGLAGNPGNLGTNSTINLGNGNNTGTLAYTGAGETTDRVINLNGTGGGATLDTTGATGALIFTSNFTATGSGAKTLTLKGGNGDTIQGAIIDSGGGATSLSKTANGTWILSGANTYSGGTNISNGVLQLTGANATLGLGNVTVTSGATRLDITTGVLNAISDTATLSLAGGGTAGVADNGFAKLGNGIDEVVAALILGGTNEAPGTYGSSTSGAANVFDEYFSGNGIITVVPEPSVYALLVAGSGLIFGARRFRRRRD